MRAIILLAGLALGGCANTAALRDTSNRLATYAAAQGATVREARARFDATNANLARVTGNVEQEAALLEDANAAQARAWTLAGRRAEAMIAADAHVPPLALVPESATEGIRPLDTAALEETLADATSTAAALGRPPSLSDRAASALGILASVLGAVEDAQAAAKDDTETAATVAATTPNP